MNRRSCHVCPVVACCLAILAGLPRAAAAEWHLTPLIGFTFAGDTTVFSETDLSETDEFTTAAGKAHWSFGGSVVLIGSWPVGVEALAVYTPGFLQQDLGILQTSRTTALMGNLVLATPRRWNEYGLRPFVSGGFGLLRVSAEDIHDLVWDRPVNLFGYNVGGGAIGFIRDDLGVRFDLRYFSHVRSAPERPPTSIGRIELTYWNAALGLVFRY